MERKITTKSARLIVVLKLLFLLFGCLSINFRDYGIFLKSISISFLVSLYNLIKSSSSIFKDKILSNCNSFKLTNSFLNDPLNLLFNQKKRSKFFDLNNSMRMKLTNKFYYFFSRVGFFKPINYIFYVFSLKKFIKFKQ